MERSGEQRNNSYERSGKKKEWGSNLRERQSGRISFNGWDLNNERKSEQGRGGGVVSAAL